MPAARTQRAACTGRAAPRPPRLRASSSSRRRPSTSPPANQRRSALPQEGRDCSPASASATTVRCLRSPGPGRWRTHGAAATAAATAVAMRSQASGPYSYRGKFSNRPCVRGGRVPTDEGSTSVRTIGTQIVQGKVYIPGMHPKRLDQAVVHHLGHPRWRQRQHRLRRRAAAVRRPRRRQKRKKTAKATSRHLATLMPRRQKLSKEAAPRNPQTHPPGGGSEQWKRRTHCKRSRMPC